MPTQENTPLLGLTRGHDGASTKVPFKPLKSTRYLLLGSWINVLLIAVPLSFIADLLHWSAAARFATSFLAIVPLAKLLGDSTEQLSMKLVELIVAIAALIQNELRLVQTSLLGSVLSNLLLVLGMSFFASSLLTLACITLILPAAYHASNDDTVSATIKTLLEDGAPDPNDSSLRGLLVLSRGTSIILLLTYFGYLYFQLRTHAQLFEAEENEDEEAEVASMDQWSAGAWLVIITVITSFCADILVGSIDETAEQWHIPKSIQIAAGMIPLLVIIAWPLHKDLTLFFANFETIVLFVSVMLVNLLLQDGRTNYMEGVMLIALYLVIALSYLV
ncbi:calcium/proton exchanger [Kwoniella shivajii]|uniref:Calcium/proton exchanger n=1 Tax=Kwoniella shivajii TaxID=564305 RepID=A0ABZ1D1C2_9TREE|nr:calcium/proton exchanger [Kwoniella shivajii]